MKIHLLDPQIAVSYAPEISALRPVTIAIALPAIAADLPP